MPECARIVAALRGQVPRVCECVTVPKPPPTPVGSRCHRRLSRCNPSAEAFRFQTANTGNRLYVMENVFRKLYCDPSTNPRGGSFRMLHVVWWKREQKKAEPGLFCRLHPAWGWKGKIYTQTAIRTRSLCASTAADLRGQGLEQSGSNLAGLVSRSCDDTTT